MVVPSSMVRYLLLQLRLALVFFPPLRWTGICVSKLGKGLAAHRNLAWPTLYEQGGLFSWSTLSMTSLFILCMDTCAIVLG